MKKLCYPARYVNSHLKPYLDDVPSQMDKLMTLLALTQCIVLLVVVTIGNANASNIELYSCRNGLFPSEQTSLKLVTPNDKIINLYFYDDSVNCPDNEQLCKTKSYVVTGDELIINKVSGEWACAWYNGKKSETVGWVRSDSIQLLPAPKSPEMNDWVGKWQMYNDDGNEIYIRSKGDKLSVEGKAVWLGIMLDDGNRVVHLGDLDGEIVPVNSHAKLAESNDEYACIANFTLLGKYLIVTDNSKCGGMNVRFDGVYTKTK
jgi:hypothetical protein